MPATFNPHRRPFAAEPVSSTSTIVVHPDHDPGEFDRLLDENHYLSSQCQAGNYLRQRIYFKGNLVGLLSWVASRNLGKKNRLFLYLCQARIWCQCFRHLDVDIMLFFGRFLQI